ncbi:MAG: flagellar biosynthesis anti-sigma factor FlgM [Oscillospiraceae bacterium]|nr:flagellar biosynthesis anti-sigma factor FlgM [Oscillospiraceae bacterium]
MRIDAFNQVTQLYKTNSTKKAYKTSTTQAADRLEISQMGKDYQIAKNAVAAAPDVRADKVNAIKQQLASGTYNVSMEEVADKLINSSFNLSI